MRKSKSYMSSVSSASSSMSMAEQLAKLFNVRNSVVHSQEEEGFHFSTAFKERAKWEGLCLDELSRFLRRGVKPGKVIRKMLLQQCRLAAADEAAIEGLNTEQAEELLKQLQEDWQIDRVTQELVALLLAAKNGDQVQFATTAKEIAWVYHNGPQSCMVDSFAAGIAGVSYSSNPNIAIAWLPWTSYQDDHDAGKVSARCIVNLTTRKFGKVYGDQSSVLSTGLKELGYSQLKLEDEQSDFLFSPILGERIFVPTLQTIEELNYSGYQYIHQYPIFYQGYSIPSLRPREVWIECYKKIMTINLHAPWVDGSSYLAETDHWEWRKIDGKRYFGVWMEVVLVRYNQENKGLLVTQHNDPYLGGTDWTGRLWSFRAHARACEEIRSPTLLRQAQEFTASEDIWWNLQDRMMRKSS